MKYKTETLCNMLQKQYIRCSSNVYYPEKIYLNMLSVYGQGERDGDETLTNSWWMHLTNKVLLEIKNPSEITHEKISLWRPQYCLTFLFKFCTTLLHSFCCLASLAECLINPDLICYFDKWYYGPKLVKPWSLCNRSTLLCFMHF